MSQVYIVLSMLIKEKQQILMDIYWKNLKISTNRLTLHNLVNEIIKSLELTSKTEYELIESLSQFYKDYWKNKTFEEFCNIISGWILLNELQHIPTKNIKEEYIKYLQKTKSYYESVIIQAQENDKKHIIKELFKK